MRRKNGNIDRAKAVRKLAVGCLLLFAFAGHTMAQDGQFVIKKGDHYLSHVKIGDTWVLKDNTTFHPDSCLWYSGTEFNSSGTNHNYYFFDGENYRFLSAPLQASGSLSLSASLPYTYLLRNPDEIYYFYDWDPDDYGRGVARGKRYYDADSLTCQYNWEYNQCWEVYWVEYAGGTTWKMSDYYSYHITPDAGRFRPVEINETIEVTSGGLTNLEANGAVIPSEGIVMEFDGTNRVLSADLELPYAYIVHSTYSFEGDSYLINTSGSATTATYHWTISGPATTYLSFDSGSHSSSSETPTLYYTTENTTGNKTATLTLTVTYDDGSSQTLSTSILVKTLCQNPTVMSPIITNMGVTLRWYNTNATAYTVSWRKANTEAWTSVNAGTATSYDLVGLDYATAYEYKIQATCEGGDPTEPTVNNFTTNPEPGLVVYGAVYGGGRMADVGGKTEVGVINCDSLGAVYGGNDIAGAVLGALGSKITLGVNADDTYYSAYGNHMNIKHTTDTIKIGSVYGGGNGHYAYQGDVFQVATDEYYYQVVPDGDSVCAMTQLNQVGNVAWKNKTGDADTLYFPTIIKTEIVVTNNYIKADSVFGGAKNAFLTLNDPEGNGSSITVDGGTLFAVFGGNNIGGTQKLGKHHIVVNQTKTKLALGIESTPSRGTGRDFGIRYLFGGGNKVAGSATDIYVYGGQLDTVFGGGNAADVRSAYVKVDCQAGQQVTGLNYAFGNVYSNAVTDYADGVFSIDTLNYPWDGNGLYNVHTLFGGNNKAHMYSGVPVLELTSGGLGTVYGGGNAGDMKSYLDGTIQYRPDTGEDADFYFKYGAKVELNSATTLVDYLYGGCQMSNVDYSTWVDIKNGHVGSVYGGCNVSGDVGSWMVNEDEPGPEGLPYQEVKGGTYVKATGGIIYQGFFGGSNGFYHCNDGTKYKEGINYADTLEYYIGMLVPTHNETHLFISRDAQAGTEVTIKGDAYTGGNLACVGFTNFTVPRDPVTNAYMKYPQFVGLSSLHMDGGRVEGDVYGGGRMASVYGSNEVKVSGGYIGGALYGGNDRTGQVAQITNRIWPNANDYTVASDGYTSLAEVHTYVGITGTPHINIVYGGGNGAYDYENGDMEYCLSNDQPIQSNTFVDVNLQDNGHINTVFGGGNGVTVTGGITVFLNVEGEITPGKEHVGTIFGGNNLGSLDILSDIIMLHGQVDVVYGGCNKGAMLGSQSRTSGDGGTTYDNLGSFVRLYNEYKATPDAPLVIPDAVVTGAVYGGCRMNGVTNNSMVLVEGGNHPTASIFGGSDISGDVGGLSHVVLTAGTHNIGDETNGPVVYNVYGGGNGNYAYDGNKVYSMDTPPVFLDSIPAGIIMRPYGDYTQVDMLGGTAANIYGGGNAAGVYNDALVNVNGGKVTNGVYGGCCAYDTIHGDVNVNIYDGALGTSEARMTDGIYGGGYGAATATKGDVTVTIGDGTNPTIYADVYGGSALGQVNTSDDLTKVDFKNGTLHGILYGGGKGSENDSTLVNGDVEVYFTNGTIYNGIYGGCNYQGGVAGDILVNILNGQVGFDGVATGDVFGGGYGQLTATSGSVEVNVMGTSAKIYGDVYGGSGLGKVNTFETGKTTTVNILDGFIKQTTIDGVTYGGNVYGGGLGSETIEALVFGKIYVNVGMITATDTIGHAVIEDAVYGCNNVNGSPQDSVFVNIVRTAHGVGPENNEYPMVIPGGGTAWNLENLALNEPIQKYAIRAVYGGGNKAAYTPPLTADGLPRCATVHVFFCKENTIKDVYGGGNAADVGITDDPDTTEDETLQVNTVLIIDGGRIHRSFGGGNGYSAATPPNHNHPELPDYNPGANIFGSASSYIYAGLIDEVYGGANQWGSIDTINLNVKSNGCGNEVYRKVFGCANEAPINHSVTTTIGCPVGEIGELYGGSNLADIGDEEHIGANVTLNVYGGEYESVFGGSKGQVEGDVHADIYGNVTLNIYGGKIVKAFGGSDQLGNVFGTITVNVDTIPGCGYQLDTVFGAGNVTYYEPYRIREDGTPVIDPASSEGEIITGPIVNIINGTVRQAVFGAGKGSSAYTKANPQVNIGFLDKEQNLARVGFGGSGGDVYGGGFQGTVFGDVVVNVQKADTVVANTIIYHDVYGGGDMASVNSTEVNIYDGTIISGIYGGCNEWGTVHKDIAVNIYGGVLGNEETPMTKGIFGGGFGEDTKSSSDVTVIIGGEGYSPEIYADVYGGSALGSVNSDTVSTLNLTKVWLKTGSITGSVFGGGLGQKQGVNGATSNIAAQVNGNIEVIGDGTDVSNTIFGCNNLLGDPDGTVSVTINDGTIGNVMGGGSVADYSAPEDNFPYVHINGGTVVNKVVGGGNEASITGSPYVLVSGGQIGTSAIEGIGVYGGCNTTGDVSGNTTVLLTGGTVGVNSDSTANIHGGGYGQPTKVYGRVFVQFGTVSNDTLEFPKLFGELYGGSALGDVNNGTTAATPYGTTVNIVNGTIEGAVYGGGLGQRAGINNATTDIEAHVYGVVHVNIGLPGEDPSDDYIGKPTLINCDVYGCNNLNGSPQDTVFVDVYQTAHIPDNEQSNYNLNTTPPTYGSYAIHQVFGGGNQSDFVIPTSDTTGKMNYVHIHRCENTIWRLFGGGNAAAVYGIVLTIDGGRFEDVFGGGNGETGVAANIGNGGITIYLGGGVINSLFNGSNEHGDVSGDIVSETFVGCDEGVVVDHFMGSNETEIVGNITEIIGCDSDMRYINLYCGSNVAQIYGNIDLTIAGGIFENVFGGSKGRINDPVLPDYASGIHDIDTTSAIEGHVHLFISGGSIGNIFGACDLNGNVDGKVSIIVQESDTCSLFIGNIYGGSNHTNYVPINLDTIHQVEYPEYAEYSPMIIILRATVGGLSENLPVIYNPSSGEPRPTYEGNVFGGGYYGNVTSNPIIVLGDKDHPNDGKGRVEILGNVFGGGKHGDLIGNTKIVVVPTTPAP